MLRIKLFAFLFLIAIVVNSQSKKTVEALSITTPIKIDGILNDDAYQHAIPATDFIQIQPLNGSPAMQPTSVYIFYDQAAIYVGAMLYDSSPDSIFNYLTARDEIGMSDYFGIYFDPYNQGQLAYGFFITPAGVQTDLKAIKKEFDYEDGNWDAVWESKTSITSEGWSVEMRIPYSTLRFPEKEVHLWGLNMFRNIRRYSSNNSWNMIDREVDGFIHQQGTLTGIKNIKPPVRLSFSPYVASYLEFDEAKSSTNSNFKGGMDLKYGISESFTLDMMLVPDFGQIQSDDAELNLSPYELYYNEKRQFFTEGTELFERAGIFYSRRIGGYPKFASNAYNNLNSNEVVGAPTETQLVNATKISGRQKNGFGVGFLNAMSLKSYATINDTLAKTSRKELIQPFTNYNVMVIDQTLKNNSYISLINTNMSMVDDPFMANVTATDFQLRNKAKTYALTGKGGISTRGSTDKETGFFGRLAIDKNSGKLNYGVGQQVLSDQYNPNDMGYIRRNNEVITSLYSSYHIIEPFSVFREMHMVAWCDYYRIYNPNAEAGSEFGLNMNAQLKNNYWIYGNWGVETIFDDYFEPRVDGRFYTKGQSNWFNFGMESDNRKKLSTELGIGASNRSSTDEFSLWADVETAIRIGQHMVVEYGFSIKNDKNDKGFVDKTDDEDTIYFANRDVFTIENVAEISYAFNDKLSLDFRARHYWSAYQNKLYYQLQNDGSLIYDPIFQLKKNNVNMNNNNVNIFNIDMNIRWVFAPGSEMMLSWKNSIYSETTNVIKDYRSNIDILKDTPQINTLSLKVLYYIDYNRLAGK